MFSLKTARFFVFFLGALIVEIIYRYGKNRRSPEEEKISLKDISIGALIMMLAVTYACVVSYFGTVSLYPAPLLVLFYLIVREFVRQLTV